MADWAGERVGLHFIPPSQPWRNGYIESFNSRVRDECLNINMFWSLAQSDVLLGDRGGDDLFGDEGRDELHGGDGNDTMSGGDGSDLCSGGAGRDSASSCELASLIP